MKKPDRLFNWTFRIGTIPAIAFISVLILSTITINGHSDEGENLERIYLSTNGYHLEIIIHKNDLEPQLLKGLIVSDQVEYLSFAMGDEAFYLNIQTVNNLTLRSAHEVLFQKSPTLIHITRYRSFQRKWTTVRLTKTELLKVNQLLEDSFQRDEYGNKIILPGSGYFSNDDFYKSNEHYTCFNTCNTWANTIFKESGLKSCLWTPFDFGLLRKY